MSIHGRVHQYTVHGVVVRTLAALVAPRDRSLQLAETMSEDIGLRLVCDTTPEAPPPTAREVLGVSYLC